MDTNWISCLLFALVVISQAEIQKGGPELTPQFLEPMKNVTVEVGEDATLICKVDQIQGYQVAWTDSNTQEILAYEDVVVSWNRRISVSHDESRENWMLHISNARLRDTGAYMCFLNTDSVMSQQAFLEVVLPADVGPPIVEVDFSPEHIYEGLDVYFYCLVESNYPQGTVVWFFNDSIIPTNNSDILFMSREGQVPNYLLLLKSIDREWSGDFACEAENKVGKARSPPVNIDVQYPPKMESPETNVTVNSSYDATLPCAYKANPMQPKGISWYYNEYIIDVSDKDSFDGGTPDHPSLIIKSVNESYSGNYRCLVENPIGSDFSTVFLTIHSKPKVALRMEPESPVSELDHLNVTLFCDVVSGNPPSLTKVWWYLDEELLKEVVLSQCDKDAEDCNSMDNKYYPDYDYIYRQDPDKLYLEDVSRFFDGKYSCVGFNEAGMGEMSPQNRLEVLYPPGKATIVTDSLQAVIVRDSVQVVKGDSLTLTCHVADLGRPLADRFIWTCGGHVVGHVTSSTWVIASVTRQIQANISCAAVNTVGQGEVGWIGIEVLDVPECIIRQSKLNDEIDLTCKATANPDNVSFSWKKGEAGFSDNLEISGTVKNEDLSNMREEDLTDISDLAENDGLESVAHVGELSQETIGTYYCFVSNAIGRGEPCKLQIHEQSFYSVLKRLDEVSSQLTSVETKIETLGKEEHEVLVKLANQNEKINEVLENQANKNEKIYEILEKLQEQNEM